MNIVHLYGIQKEVDQLIEEKMGGSLVLTDYLSVEHRTFAFQCELMELANEIGFFKDWKHSHEVDRHKALEELADCFAFAFSIGLTKNYDNLVKELDVSNSEFMKDYPYLDIFVNLRQNELSTIGQYRLALEMLVAIGLKLGATVDEICEWYEAKSNKNIQRQKEGY